MVRVEQKLGRHIETPATIEFIEVVADLIDVATGRDGFAITKANRVERSKPIIEYDECRSVNVTLVVISTSVFEIILKKCDVSVTRQSRCAIST